MVENFLWLQNHFLDNRFERKISLKNFWSKIFYVCKIISSKIGSHQKFSWNIFWSNIFCGWKIISRKYVQTKNFQKHFWVENFLWLQNHFLENRFEWKISFPNFFVLNFYSCKIISSKTGFDQKFSITHIENNFFTKYV